MAVAALGRPFTLGMLFDARRDELIPGFTLWDETTLQKNTVRSSHHSSEFEITTSDSIESKSSLLDVEASLKASFLGGLIEVGGSAKYLNDKKKYHNQSRVICQYKATTNFKQLSMTHLATMNTQQMGVIEKGFATHVVTGILYGANAFFVFDSDKLETSSIKDIQGCMEAVIKKIPLFHVEGKADIKLSDEEKALTDKLSCKFYGDFIIESNPATFEEAVKTYIQLPKLLGKNGENSVPLKVWLIPLKNLYSKAAEVRHEISVGLVKKAQDALEDLHQLEKGCNDLLEDKIVKDFPKMQEKLSSFQTLCIDFRSALEQTMAKKLPLIRAGEEDESKLEKVFEDRGKSSFSHEKLTKCLEDKEREINVIRSCVEMMEGTKTIPNQSELDREVLAPGVQDTLCFVFTSLKTTDPYLKALANFMDQFKLQGTVSVTATPPAQGQWYFSAEVITKMKEKAKAFHNLAKVLKNSSRFCFLVAAAANKKYTGASIYHYKDSILVTDDFSKPDIPNVKNVTDRRDFIWYACDLTLDPDTAHNRLTLSEGNKKATHGASQSYPNVPQRFKNLSQVLCREGLTGRCYWEVEWSAGYDEDVAVGVTYKGLIRKGKGNPCRLGWNTMSWCFGHRWSPSEATLYAEHEKLRHNVPVPVAGCTRLGVYLDWPAGTLSYYNVSSDTLSHLYTFHNKFSEPVYPAFTIWRESNFVFLSL
ncbi:stonustoxin subunit alpha-like [Enoplosus armatus]|uniref:stonustoxin subunit alpha-like n=1 Tax=Enoplosus armatus TaxID=215367 RepID=UPI003996637E